MSSLRDRLEKTQVWVYLLAIAIGLGLGLGVPGSQPFAEALIWPGLALLMYSTFSQVSLTEIPQAIRDGRFLAAALVGNFLLIPWAVWGLVHWAPDSPAARLGLLMTLVAPCTDWFITFAQLGRGDSLRATALAPLNMLIQLPLVPLYISLFANNSAGLVLDADALIPAAAVILVPLTMVACTEALISWGSRAEGSKRPQGHRGRRPVALGRLAALWHGKLGVLPVPLLAVVILCVMTSHAGEVVASLDLLPKVGRVCVAYLMVALVLAKVLARALHVTKEPARTLAFTFGTRNSFVVLPLALALPAGWGLAAVVVIMQSIIELLGMIVFLWFVPRVLFPDDAVPDDVVEAR
ncbi:MAG: hypothetical protein L0G59_01600 [Kocuria sp.]|nr:hypothetical protein [Kocuria sp.]MDN5616735.1 hypothetical protein [Kocuria sp.]MDN5654523.1 hypothetical protein [Kocuria sp.]